MRIFKYFFYKRSFNRHKTLDKTQTQTQTQKGYIYSVILKNGMKCIGYTSNIRTLHSPKKGKWSSINPIIHVNFIQHVKYNNNSTIYTDHIYVLRKSKQ